MLEKAVEEVKEIEALEKIQEQQEKKYNVEDANSDEESIKNMVEDDIKEDILEEDDATLDSDLSSTHTEDVRIL